MTKPARQNQQARIFALQKQQSWIVLAWIVIAIAVDMVVGVGLLSAKSFSMGVLLSYITQSTFTFIAYQKTGAKVRQAIMLNMYLGQMVKWLATLMGFALIFVFIKPIIALLVVVGYLVMQITHIVVMWRFL
ncbi:ATP synthase subunit I [Moraxella oblonga]|uniref:ATP synthase subunit I n=1 Tax=Moraxella oblonga TaxID=200413 RepID=UPI00082D8FE0|nr:ATP synthase subunit I [Moraxella oblonga]